MSLLACFAYCGAIGLGGCHEFRTQVAPENVPPAGFQNVPLSSFMVSGQGHWWVCPGCMDVETRELALKYQSMLQPSYVSDVLSMGNQQSQLMCLVGLNLHLESMTFGVPSGWLSKNSIFDGPLYLANGEWSPRAFVNV